MQGEPSRRLLLIGFAVLLLALVLGGPSVAGAQLPPNNCLVGTYPAPAPSKGCAPCPAGYYCPRVGGGTQKIICPGGRFCPPGSANANKQCAAGQYCPQGSAWPVPCPPGRMCVSNAQAAPGPVCSPGLYCPGGAPVTCPPGRYCPTAGMTAVGPVCPGGSYCPGRSVNPMGPCPAGRYCPPGTSWAIPCPGGYYCPTAGLAAAGPACPAGRYCPRGSVQPTLCPSGYYCPAGSEAPRPCPNNRAPSPTGATSSSQCLS